MREIDLIPQEYHQQQMMSGWLKSAGIALLAISALILVGFTWLKLESSQLEGKIEQLQSQKEITSSHRAQLEQLTQKKKDLQQQLKLLAGLRSGAAAEQMFVTIDRALPNHNVWITGWRFRRAGTPVEKVDETVNTGYFIVIPSGSGNSKKTTRETWKIETQMTIKGQSMDHAALSEFVLNLTRQPEIEDVRVVNTQLAEVNQVKLVNFNLDIVVSTLRSRS